MMDHKAGIRYARALFALAGERRELEEIEKEFIRVRALVERHPEITHLVLNSTISSGEKEDFIDKVLTEKGRPSSALLLNFLKVLIKKRRFKELTAIQEEFHRLYEKKQGIREVRAITAIPLSRANEDKMRMVLKKRLQSEIRLVTEIDPGILGGLILRFDDGEIDASFRNRLHELKQKLMA